MLLSALTGTAAAAAETTTHHTHEDTPICTTSPYETDYDYDDYESPYTTECYHEHDYEATEGESVLDRIISAVRRIIDRFINFLRSVFDKEEIPEDDEEESYTDGPLYMTDTDQFTLAGDRKAEALCNEFNNLMRGFDELEADAEITKHAEVDINITDMRLPAATSDIVNKAIEAYLVDDTTTETFYKGEGAYNVQNIRLSAEGLKKAEKKTFADGSCYYEFELIEEAAYFDGYTTLGIFMYEGEATRYKLYHDRVADTLYVELFDFGPCRIDRASILYPGATITATTDADGRITELSVEMPVEGTGDVKIAFLGGKLNLEGYRNEYYTIDWLS